MTEIRIIKSYVHEHSDVEAYISWVTESPIVLLDENDLIYQLAVEGRYFVALWEHWDKFKSSNHKMIYATELYNLVYKE